MVKTSRRLNRMCVIRTNSIVSIVFFGDSGHKFVVICLCNLAISVAIVISVSNWAAGGDCQPWSNDTMLLLVRLSQFVIWSTLTFSSVPRANKAMMRRERDARPACKKRFISSPSLMAKVLHKWPIWFVCHELWPWWIFPGAHSTANGWNT